jgi:hypothetical protein
MKSDHSRSSPAFESFAVARASVQGMRLVVIESPFAGDVSANIAYATRAVHDCLMRAEAPIASHLLFTQPGVLDDDVPGERALGIEAGLSWYRVAQACVAYIDRGISGGMRLGMERARAAGIPVEIRRIGGGE